MNTVLCALCGSEQYFHLFRGKDRDWDTGDEFNVVRCKKCGLVYTNPRPDKEEIKKYYPSENWSRAQNKVNVEDAVISGAHWSVAIAERVEPILKLGINGKILDIGCGDGLLLYYLKQYGWDCYGVEPGEIAARYANETLGLNVLNITIDNIRYENDFFDVVNLHHVFEHLDEPLEALRQIKYVLKSDGYLVIGVPNFNGFDSKIFGKRWVGLKLPQHLFQYTEKTLKAMVEKSGFKIESVNYKSYEAKNTMYYSESLRYVLRDWGIYPKRENNGDKIGNGSGYRESMFKKIFHLAERGVFKTMGFVFDKLKYGSTITMVAKKQYK